MLITCRPLSNVRCRMPEEERPLTFMVMANSHQRDLIIHFPMKFPNRFVSDDVFFQMVAESLVLRRQRPFFLPDDVEFPFQFLVFYPDFL